jgi:hypothetical protein
MNITETVKSYEDVCKIQGIDPVKSLPFPEPQTEEEKAINGFTKVIRAIAVLNEGWKPDWTDFDQLKYYPWFYMKKNHSSGPGFSYGGYDCDNTYSRLGSRLVLKSRKLAEHMAEYFLEDYKSFMVIES